MTNQEINEKLQEIENKLFENTNEEDIVFLESNIDTLQKELTLFYEHLIKSVVQPIRLGRSWINTMNESRIKINKIVIDSGNHINSNQYKKLMSYIDISIHNGKVDAASVIAKGDKELSKICEKFISPEFYSDLENFVFNTERLKEYIVTEIKNNKYRPLTKSEIYEKENYIENLVDVTLKRAYKGGN